MEYIDDSGNIRNTDSDSYIENLNKLLDQCDTTDFGLAEVAYAVIGKQFQYDTKWYEFNINTNRWDEIYKDYKVRVALSTKVASVYSVRSDYWNQRASLELEQSQKYRQCKALAGMQKKIEKKLKSAHVKNTIIQECKCLFYTLNN